jgi:hypothetical protein
MLAYCPAGMEQTIIFQFLFLQLLPVALWTLLGEQETDDIRSLADKLWATLKSHSLMIWWPMWIKQRSSRLRLLQSRERSLNRRRSLPGISLVGGRRRPLRGGQAKATSGSCSSSGSDSGVLTHAELAWVGSGLCYFHWDGAKANKSVASCSWAGN